MKLDGINVTITKRYLKTDLGKFPKGIIKTILNKLKTSNSAGVPSWCDICANWTCGGAGESEHATKRQNGSVRVGCTVLSKKNVSLIRKWAYSK